MKKNTSHPTHSQKGAVAVMVALTLPALIAAAAFAVDLANWYVVRNELQNDADAAALAGAQVLYQSASTGLKWADAAQRSMDAVGLNHAAGKNLKTGQVQTGYWSLVSDSSGFQTLPMTPKGSDAPAVQVKVSKNGTDNGGPVLHYLASYWGNFSTSASASAVAGVTSPGRINPGSLFPFAMSECMFQKYWNSSAQPAGPRLDPLTGMVYVFKVGSIYQYESCNSGEWTSLDIKVSGADDIDGMIKTGNLVSLAIGDDIWIQTGVKTSLFQDVQKCSAAGDKSCQYVLMPVMSQMASGTFSSITAFACLQILNAVGGNQKYIEVQMSTTCKAPNSDGAGPNYGVLSPPSLFK